MEKFCISGSSSAPAESPLIHLRLAAVGATLALLLATGCSSPGAAFLNGGTAAAAGTTNTGSTQAGSGSSGSSSGSSGSSGSSSGGGNTSSGGSSSGGSTDSGSSGSSGSGGSGSTGTGSGGTNSGGSGSGGGSTSGGNSGPALPAVQAYAADAFVDSIGINTHLTYTNTPYASQWPQVITALKSLGVRHVRDGYYPWPAGHHMYKVHQQLAESGIHCNYVVTLGADVASSQVATFAGLAGDVESLEAPNECDAEGGVNCGGKGWLQNLQDFLPALSEAGKALHVPVYGPSFTKASSYPAVGNIASKMTQNNLHVYFGGRNPESRGWGSIDADGNGYGSFEWWLDNAQIDGPGLSAVVTESGYIANPTAKPYTVPQGIEALYVPRTLLTAFGKGVKRTYLYELIDEVSSPGYGLMSSSLEPKPAYTALLNLISLADDPGPSWSPGSLQYEIDGGDVNLQQMLLQKRDGSFLLILWKASSSYDPAGNVATSVAPEILTLQVAGGTEIRKLYQFDQAGQVTDIQPGGATSQVLSVSDALLIVKIGNVASAKN